MIVPYVDIASQFSRDREVLMPAIERVLQSGMHVNAPQVNSLEQELANFHEVGEVVCLNSGTDALVFALKSLGVTVGDEVITQSNSFIASTAAIVQVGATPVFVDVLEDQSMNPQLVKEAVNKNTKVIMPVHLTGHIGNIEEIVSIAHDHDIFIVEDAAQAIGAHVKGKKAGTFGSIGCFSAHPLKNLGACGDAGFITTNNKSTADQIRLLRNHGLENRDQVATFGHVSRMDAIQAVILSIRLQGLNGVIKKRQEHAEIYRELLKSDKVTLPSQFKDHEDCYHTFVVQVDHRDELQKFLAQADIGSAIHYPIPIHLQPAAKDLGYGVGSLPVTEAQAARILSLPIHETLEREQIEYVAATVNRFYERL